LIGTACAAPAGAANTATAITAYQAPQLHPAPRRVGGSSRGVPPALPMVAALVPDHLGLTTAEQPTLYWFLSAPTGARIEIALIRPGEVMPVLEVSQQGDQAGIRALDLKAHGVRLQPGVEYEWSVALVPDSAERSRDIVAGGAIMRLTPAAASAYSAAGLWYDMLMAAAGQPDARAALLMQAGLAEVARFEHGE
jgi:hypothetical protein